MRVSIVVSGIGQAGTLTSDRNGKFKKDKKEGIAMTRPRYFRRKQTTHANEIEKLNEVKWQICTHINKYMVRHQRTRQWLAYEMETSVSCASKVLNYKVEELSLSQLFKYFVRLNPRFKVLISPY